MRRLALALLAPLALAGAHAAAQDVVVVETIEWVEDDIGGERALLEAAAQVPEGIAAFGPFRVLDPARAALVSETDAASPAAFAAMLRAYPGLSTIEMIECPGTLDDNANLKLGRMIRAAGLATHVPEGGSVRSGAVELFLAGARRSADPESEFAVHAWLDEDGREPDDFAATAPVHRAYLAYYREMGMSAAQAEGFYALTNSVPHAQALWLGPGDIARFASLN